MSNKPLVIYHKGCLDGIAAAWVFYTHFGDALEYHEGVYGDPIPDVKGKLVYMLDFSYKSDVMIEILKQAKEVIILDHHESAINDLATIPLEYSNLNMSYCTTKNSGCIIAWNYLKSSKPLKILEYIQDRDLWKFELPGTKEICAALYAGEPTYKLLSDLNLSRLLVIGSALVKAQESNVERIIKTCARSFVLRDNEGGMIPVPVVNANHMFSSDIGNALANLTDLKIGATYYDTETHRQFSLRSIEGGPNVAEIAAIYGGGGHKHASGFRVPREHALAQS